MRNLAERTMFFFAKGIQVMWRIFCENIPYVSIETGLQTGKLNTVSLVSQNRFEIRAKYEFRFWRHVENVKFAAYSARRGPQENTYIYALEYMYMRVWIWMWMWVLWCVNMRGRVYGRGEEVIVYFIGKGVSVIIMTYLFSWRKKVNFTYIPGVLPWGA